MTRSAKSSLHNPKPWRKRIGGEELRLWIVDRVRLTPLALAWSGIVV